MLKFIRTFLLVLILIGLGLIFTQKLWVPKLVDRILSEENHVGTPPPPDDNVTPPPPPPSPVGEFWGAVLGTVMLGPTCPVVQNPPDPQCADRPYSTKLALTTADGVRTVKTFTSDKEGKFYVEILAGQYTIRSRDAANVWPYCSSEMFTVKANGSANVNVSCDTGIR